MPTASRLRVAARSPLVTPDLKLWLRADAIIGLADGATVNSWPDSSGNGNTVPRGGSSAPLYKTGIINGLPVVRFSGDDFFIKGSAPVGMNTQAFTAVVVVSHTTATGTYIHVGQAIGGRQFMRDASFTELVKANDSVVAAGTTAHGTSSFGIFALTCQPGAQAFYKTGMVADGTGTTTTTFTDTSANLWIGMQVFDVQFLSGDLAELLWYDAVLTTDQLEGIYDHLGQKYSL